MNVQIYGTNKSSDTKKALRFFKERSIKPQFFDLKERFMSEGELNRFVQKYSLDALVNKTSKAYKDAGLEYMRLSTEQLIAKLIDNPELMIQPLVRSDNTLSIGWDEKLWRDWHKSG